MYMYEYIWKLLRIGSYTPEPSWGDVQTADE